MDIIIRFGNVKDLDFITKGDKSIKINQLNWKLQNNEILLAVVDKVIVGYLRLEYLWSKYPYIGLIMVHPDHQRQGVGKELLKYLEDYLTQQGIHEIYSSSQENESEPQEWHRQMGFNECGMINGINEGNIGEIFLVKHFDKRGKLGN